MPTVRTAINDIYTMFKTAWDADPLTTGKQVQWDNVSSTNPSGSDGNGNPVIFARVSVRHISGTQASLADPDGQRRFEHTGIVVVETFTPAGYGVLAPLDVADVVKNAFEGKKSTNGVWFRNVGYNELGVKNSHYQVNITATFEYDQIG